MSLKAAATSRCSLEPSSAGARVQVPAGHRAGGAGERAQRTGERTRQQPGHAQPEQQRERAHTHEGQRVAPHLLLDRVHALRHAHGPDRPVAPHHGHGGEEDVLSERVAVARALVRLST